MKAAIYSRKSVFTGKGESIENQIELCKEYGKRLNVDEYLIYEDEGFSGGNTNRPKFKELIKDANDKKFNVLICYRLDRISRNVADFASTLEMLQKNNIDFVSIKEQFDTSTPMGRAMVYISSVFAQLERETIAERVRDNMVQLSKTGRWLGGQTPLGFDAERTTYIDDEFKERSLMKLIPIPSELDIVKMVFSKYTELQSISQVAKYLNEIGLKGKNGGYWQTMQIKRILSNPIYVKSNDETHSFLRNTGINVFGTPNKNGYLTYNKTKNTSIDRDINEWIASVGAHEGIIEASDWLKVQDIMADNKDKKFTRLGTSTTPTLLSGILKCEKCGSNMRIKQGHPLKDNPNQYYKYYVCGSKEESYGKKCDNKNVRTDVLDSLVISQLKAYSKEYLIKELSHVLNKEDSNNLISTKIKSFQNTICEKENSISNLLNSLSMSPSESVSKYIFSEIDKITNEISSLKKEIDNLNHRDLSLSNNMESLREIIDSLVLFNNEYNALYDIKLKRNLLQTVVDYITWDGINKTFKIQLFNEDKKKLYPPVV